jgi:hypothetical protein
MAQTGQQSDSDKLRTQLLQQAYTKAAAVIASKTTLSAKQAKTLAPDVVDAAAPSVRLECVQHMAAVTPAQAYRRGAAALVVLALDLATFGVVAARGPRWARAVAVLAMAGHTALVVSNRRDVNRLRAAARSQVAGRTP